ncbi:homologous-pairing protein 2 homolog isoform X2 [Fukomys damarensis]|uniref:homologous-pairing protein 2 homolog isoform X2 n=1 Tax=Fukomys damarensis TaxID=885580 RepID=UPI0014552854|nr:homologous-pairing protein 2 homolog isoform X2 [Fukomys damarensis]
MAPVPPHQAPALCCLSLGFPCPWQDQFDTVSDADLQSMDAKIVALTAKVQGLQQSCRHMEAELKELTSALTTPEMQREVEQLKAECAGYTERLRGIRAAPARVTPAEKEQVHREQQRYCREWRMRKRLVSDGAVCRNP